MTIDNDIINDTISGMASIPDILHEMMTHPANVRFTHVCKVCDHYFGFARQKGTSHRVYKTPWQGDPRVNIQSAKGKAKAYQVKQVLKAIERLNHESNSK